MFFFFKQKTAYEMRISDWSSDVCSSDLRKFPPVFAVLRGIVTYLQHWRDTAKYKVITLPVSRHFVSEVTSCVAAQQKSQRGIGPASVAGSRRASRHFSPQWRCGPVARPVRPTVPSRCPCTRSEEHTSEHQFLMRISTTVIW